MKLLITSDIHGNEEKLRAIIEQHHDVTYHLNAGDMCLNEKILEKYQVITVKGNNDFGSSQPLMRVLDFDGLKILLTHGHQEHVKFSLERLKLKAKLFEVNMVIYGHTHQRFMMNIGNVLFLNPGALGDHHNSYAIYENGHITFHQLNHGK